VQHVKVERRFDAPPEAVWKVYTDHAGWHAWSGLGRSVLVREGSPDPNGVGAVRALGPPPFAAREAVVAFEPPRRMVYRLVGGPLPMKDHEGEVCIEPDGDGARVVWRCRFASRVPGLGGLLRTGIERAFRRALDGLARVHFPDRAGRPSTSDRS